MAAVDVQVEPFREPLDAVRRVPEDAEEALLGVAFVHRRGVSLIERQLRSVGSGRLIATTVFGSTTAQGLEAARDVGFGVRVLNPSRGTFHPKLYLARRGEEITAAIGSANLTTGLVANVELTTVLRGPQGAPELRYLAELGESWWSHPEAIDWSPDRVAAAREVLEPALLRQIEAAVAADPVVATLADGRPNSVRDVTPDGVWVDTERSRTLGRPAQLVDAWMIQSAWEYLQAHGQLTNRHLLSTDGLNVKRSSFVCALLARLPGVHVSSARPITLSLTPETGVGSTR